MEWLTAVTLNRDHSRQASLPTQQRGLYFFSLTKQEQEVPENNILQGAEGVGGGRYGSTQLKAQLKDLKRDNSPIAKY